MVSAVYSTAEVGESEQPSRHSTGRVWDDMEPTDVNGVPSVTLERSLEPDGRKEVHTMCS